MTNEKLAVVNSMRIVDADISNGELVYAIVDYNQENIEKLAKVVPNVEQYIQTVGDPDGTKESIDISTAAFQYAGADCYAKGKFRNDESDLLKRETLEAEIAEAADLHLETILELQRIRSLLEPISDENEQLIAVALLELEEKFHKINDEWSE